MRFWRERTTNREIGHHFHVYGISSTVRSSDPTPGPPCTHTDAPGSELPTPLLWQHWMLPDQDTEKRRPPLKVLTDLVRSQRWKRCHPRARLPRCSLGNDSRQKGRDTRHATRHTGVRSLKRQAAAWGPELCKDQAGKAGRGSPCSGQQDTLLAFMMVISSRRLSYLCSNREYSFTRFWYRERSSSSSFFIRRFSLTACWAKSPGERAHGCTFLSERTSPRARTRVLSHPGQRAAHEGGWHRHGECWQAREGVGGTDAGSMLDSSLG